MLILLLILSIFKVSWESEGTYTIPAHAPLDIEDPQTNPYNSKLIIDGMSGTFFCSIYQANPKAIGCFQLVNTFNETGHKRYNEALQYATYKLNFSG